PDSTQQHGREHRHTGLHRQQRGHVSTDTEERRMAKADHTAQIAEQSPGEGDAADDQRGNDQAHHIVIAAQQERDGDVGGQHQAEEIGFAEFHPRLPANPKRPFGRTNSTSRNSVMPASSCSAELARVMVSASVTPSRNAPTRTPGIEPMPASTVMMNALIVSACPYAGWITP